EPTFRTLANEIPRMPVDVEPGLPVFNADLKGAKGEEQELWGAEGAAEEGAAEAQSQDGAPPKLLN
ncbi:hypothetical protein, partial [Sutterella sp.]|uniref:hypothetical protein n=1 Tax=Sutterella sp. TaxID=1981025 RepID=UPI0026DF7DFA